MFFSFGDGDRGRGSRRDALLVARVPCLVLNELPRIIKLQIPFGLIVLAAIGHSRALLVEVVDRVIHSEAFSGFHGCI